MSISFSIRAQDGGFAIAAQDKIVQTPGKHPLAVPTRALAEAIGEEWKAHQKFMPHKMPLTGIAYTAIDRIAGQQAAIVEALLVYVDTDTLSYRATSSEKLAQTQDSQWGAILKWATEALGATWDVTSGVMPIEQPQTLHWAVGKYLRALDAMRLSAGCVLASGCSSLALALAVLEKYIDGAEAFRLSRLEEEAQAEQWGRDAEADQRAERLKDDIIAATRFLRLLDAV
jgi:chaperone required for assembly of F1-ATPase